MEDLTHFWNSSTSRIYNHMDLWALMAGMVSLSSSPYSHSHPLLWCQQHKWQHAFLLPWQHDNMLMTYLRCTGLKSHAAAQYGWPFTPCQGPDTLVWHLVALCCYDTTLLFGITNDISLSTPQGQWLYSLSHILSLWVTFQVVKPYEGTFHMTAHFQPHISTFWHLTFGRKYTHSKYIPQTHQDWSKFTHMQRMDTTWSSQTWLARSHALTMMNGNQLMILHLIDEVIYLYKQSKELIESYTISKWQPWAAMTKQMTTHLKSGHIWTTIKWLQCWKIYNGDDEQTNNRRYAMSPKRIIHFRMYTTWT